ANQQIPSGTAAQSRNQSPNVRVQSLPLSRHELKAWQTGGVHVRVRSAFTQAVMGFVCRNVNVHAGLQAE
ncbi:MAG: hypothetical protein ACKOF9_12570, partial [Burkholderiales bacterium]